MILTATFRRTGRSCAFPFAQALNKARTSAWQVRRSDFDALLFRHAAKCGADARENTRVTDITRLDWAGVPVYASIRPEAYPGSLCVNAGKGVTPLEAQVGAYMEAIEYAFAEYGRS